MESESTRRVGSDVNPYRLKTEPRLCCCNKENNNGVGDGFRCGFGGGD